MIIMEIMGFETRHLMVGGRAVTEARYWYEGRRTLARFPEHWPKGLIIDYILMQRDMIAAGCNKEARGQ